MKKILGLLLCLCLLAALYAPMAQAEETTHIVFSTTDRRGETWTEKDLADYKLVMINFWEPWCPPCVGEMPDLEKLYETYQEQGFLILGVYSTKDMEDEVDSVLADCETSYPILHYCEDFDEFQTGYVPTTIFVTGDGELVGETQIGSKSYEDWESMITGFDLLGSDERDFSSLAKPRGSWDPLSAPSPTEHTSP